MEQYTIFSEKFDYITIHELIRKLRSKDKIKINGTKYNWKEIRVTENDTWYEHIFFRPFLKEQNEDYFHNNFVLGMFNLFARVQTENLLQKHQLISKIRGLKVAIGADTLKSIDSTVFKKLIFEIAREIDGIVLNNGTSFLNPDGKIILNLKGESEIQEMSGEKFGVSLEQIKRKERSEKIIREKYVNIYYGLPYLEDSSEVKIRSKEEIVQRIIALTIVIARAVTKDNRITEAIIRNYEADSFLTPEEKDFISMEIDDIDEGLQEKFLWRIHSCFVLLWSIGLLDELNYPQDNENPEEDVIKIMEVNKNFKSYQELLDKAKLRSKNEIIDEADLIYRYHWSCVDAIMKGKYPPSDLSKGIVYERHYALNWLINYMDQDWNDVSTDT